MHHPPDTEQAPEVVGKWEMLAAEFVNSATHVALLPANKIFIFGGSSLDPDEFKKPTLPRAEILDMNASPWQTCALNCEQLHGDLWCGGHTFLTDEKLEIQGPATRAHMPRGYCLLFILNHEGMPSIGKFLKVG